MAKKMEDLFGSELQRSPGTSAGESADRFRALALEHLALQRSPGTSAGER